jgi:hypothetical protein
MAFVIKSNSDIHLTKGDSMSIAIKDATSGSLYVFDAAFIAILSVKQKPKDAAFIIYKTYVPDGEGHIYITLEPADTQNVELGTYYYDVQLVNEDTEYVRTVVPVDGCSMTKFVVCTSIGGIPNV